MIYDNHVHTKFSLDSEMNLSDALAAAKRQGICLVATEHYDADLPGDLVFDFSPEDYWREYAPQRDAADSRLSLGVEVGLSAACREQNIAFLARAPFDFVIGSLHVLYGEDIYRADFYRQKTQEEVYAHYFTTMAALVRQHDYIDALGHIDYICRVAPYERPGIDYPRYAGLIDDVLRALVETDTAIELNTRRLGDPQVLKNELAPVFRRFRALGGRFATLGSDAHEAGRIGFAFKAALDFLREMEITPATFRERKRIEMK